MKAEIETYTAIVLTVVLVSWIAFFAGSLASALDSVASLDIQSDDIAYPSARQKVRCIMPPAQQKYCGID